MPTTTQDNQPSSPHTPRAEDFAQFSSAPSTAVGPTKPPKRPTSSMRSRVTNIFHRLTERPSLLSSTSDSADTSAEDEEWERYHSSSTYRDPRLYRDHRKRGRGRHQHRADGQSQSQGFGRTGTMDEGGEVEYDIDAEKEEGGSTSKVVVENDFSTWIDPTTGRLIDPHAVPDDDGASIQTGQSTTEHTETSQHARIQKATETMQVPWLAGFIENVRYFFNMSFPDKSKERAYRKDVYFVQRQIALSASAFFVVMWILVCATTPKPYDLYDYYAYIGIYGALTLPLFPIIYFNANYHMPICYQIWLTLATWVLPNITVIKTKTCGVWEPNGVTCDTRSFFIAFAAAIGQPVLALLSLNQNRLCAVVGAGQFFVLIAIFYFHQTYTPESFYRDAVYFIVFHVIILIIDAFLERRDRQMFELREQLKTQFRATQRAQLAEKRAADLKKRFAAYIFHEVRVPLNTACLTVENLGEEGAFKTLSEDQKEMVHGLSGSLQLMAKVLNDVLSFNRMETGKFSQAKAPFDFHRSIELTAMSHAVTAHSKGIELVTELDRRIDSLGCAFVGDEMRLRQITNNLVSNSLKFTPTGSVTLRTKLLLPVVPAIEPSPSPAHDGHAARNSDGFAIDLEKGPPEHALDPDEECPPPKARAAMAIVRIEIADTGVGLKAQDMVENRLFSPYVQTEIGRRQGGKGTGLGLALVRQIVELNKGRLGVESEHGKGSVFWLELPYQLKRGSVTEPRQHGSVPSSKTCVDSARGRDHSTDPILPAATIVMVDDPASLSPERSDRTRVASDATADETILRSPTSQTATTLHGSPSASRCLQDHHGERPLNALVVDDDVLTRSLMARMLGRLGHRAEAAVHGKDGLERIDAAYHLLSGSVPVDIVFLDNQMPYMSGVEVARAVRKTGNPVYIVGCTGNALREDQDEYLAAGADRVLTKPITQTAILEALELARRRLEGQSVPRDFDRLRIDSSPPP